ncbi:MAG TPA: hypothetical protein DCE27_09475 [Xanthomarina gelatinilytica]|jgi:hypothetical protein|nr:hypothetical protein [Xanthomarina gelatinilytica]|tara:strand:+ start:215 stop:724 length:510 start_codon:yes stop_codon:yes gene_type:complete
MITIKLTPEIYDKAISLAHFRYQMSRASKLKNQKQDKTRTELDIEKLGAKGEYAVATLYNLNPPIASGWDSGYDLWFSGKSLQVKTTFHSDGQLLFRSKEKFIADFAILVVQDQSCPMKMIIVGASSKNYFFDHAVKKNLGNGDVYTLSQDKMAKPQEFWKYIMETRYA